MGTIVGVVPEHPALNIVTEKVEKSSCSIRSSVRSPMPSFTIRGKQPVRSPRAETYRANARIPSMLSPPTDSSIALEDRPCMTDEYVPVPIKPLIVKQRMIAMNILARVLLIRYLKSGYWLHDLLEEHRESPLSAIGHAVFGRSKSRSSFETVSESELSFNPTVDWEDLTASIRKDERSVQDLSSVFDKQTLQDLTVALAMQSFFESEVYLFMVDEQWSVNLDGVAIVRYHPAWHPFSSLKSEKVNHAERLAKQFMLIVDTINVSQLEGIVGDEEVLYRLHNSLEANPFIAYSICCPDQNISTGTSNLSVDVSASKIKEKSYRKVYSSPAFDKQQWPSQTQPLPSHWLVKLKCGEAISAVVKLPHGYTVYVQARSVCEVVTVLRSTDEAQQQQQLPLQMAKDLCLLLSKLVR